MITTETPVSIFSGISSQEISLRNWLKIPRLSENFPNIASFGIWSRNPLKIPVLFRNFRIFSDDFSRKFTIDFYKYFDENFSRNFNEYSARNFTRNNSCIFSRNFRRLILNFSQEISNDSSWTFCNGSSGNFFEILRKRPRKCLCWFLQKLLYR